MRSIGEMMTIKIDAAEDDTQAGIAMDHCGMPAFLANWVKRFYGPVDLAMLALSGNAGLSETALGSALVAAGHAADPDAARTVIRRAVVRGVLSDTSGNGIQPADFHIRFDYWALFEGWLDIPDDVRWQLNQWELGSYIDTHRQTAADLKAGKPRDPRRVVPEYVLLHEAQALIERVPHIYLWPCNCRSMLEGCRQPRLTCLRFDNARGIGWEISKARAQSILLEASRKGLMHSAELGLGENGAPMGAICNCCSDCCFPQRLAERERVAGYWPISRYQARLDPLACNGCGRCERRCPFGAIRLRQPRDPDRPPAVRVNVDRCHGCGVCALGCRQAAIEMVRLGDSIFEAWYQPLPETPL
jgi:ferredoxin